MDRDTFIRKGKLVLLLGTILLFLAGCGQGGITYETNGKTYTFPEFVFDSQHPLAAEAYAFVTETQEELEYIPCYCSCHVEPFNHMSVKSCFIDEHRSTSSTIVYDDHGAG